MNRIAALVLICYMATAATQVAQCTVLAIVRRDKTVWIGTNSNTSAQLPNGKFLKGPADCKIHPIGKIIMLHAGPIMGPTVNGKAANFIDLIKTATSSSLSLADNKSNIEEAIKGEYGKIGQLLVASLQGKGKELPDRWVAIPAQTVFLISARAAARPEIIGFVLAMGMEKDKPHFFPTDLDIPQQDDFSLLYDGVKFPPVAEKWSNSNHDPLDWIRQRIHEKAEEDEADWGGQMVAAELSGTNGVEWQQTISPCQ